MSLAEEFYQKQTEMKLGTVTSLRDDNTAVIQFDEDSEPSGKAYSYLNSYIPKQDDRVIMAPMGNTYIILGAILYNTSPKDEPMTESDVDDKISALSSVYADKDHTHTSIKNGNYTALINSTGFYQSAGTVGSLGTSSKRWSTVYGANFNASGSVTTDSLSASSVSSTSLSSTGATSIGTANSIPTVSVGYNNAIQVSKMNSAVGLGFFGHNVANIQNVSSCSTSGALSDAITTLNNLITALKKYGLIR